MSKASIEINSKVNEIYIKTKVTQKLKNESDSPLELKIYVNKISGIIFSSFSAKIGDSIEVKSKVIQKSKAQEKYTDSIASGNAAIFVANDPDSSNRIIINMGNIPPKQEVIFISEFLQFISSSDLYEFELFRNLPLFKDKSSYLQNSEVKGTVEINTHKSINKIDKQILSTKLNIIEEKYVNENKCVYSIKYEYKNLDILSIYNSNNYIPSNKIYFEIDNENKGNPISFCQKSPKENSTQYIIHYKNTKKIENEIKDDILNPGLYIFLIDQSGSMSGHPMNVASKALILFLQSLPAGSYYQIIGFGSDYKKYDPTPKEYTQENIKESIQLIKALNADLGGTNIYEPLKDIYNSKDDYIKINLPKNIFLLTDGEIDNKMKTLDIIEEHNQEFFIYAIGIGAYFDKDLIKNAGTLGKGNYDFCTDIKDLNEIIVNEIKNASKSFYFDFEFNSNLDAKNLYKLNEKIPIIKENHIANINFIIENKNNEIEDDKTIKLNIKYKIYNKEEKNSEDRNENYEINSTEIESGEEILKLIMNDYLIKNKNLNDEEKTKLAIKYQIFNNYTSLFAEVELSEKVTEEMKKEIIGNEENNVIPIKGLLYEEDDLILDMISNNVGLSNAVLMDMNIKLKQQGECLDCYESPVIYKENLYSHQQKSKSTGMYNFFKSIGNSIKGIFSKNSKDSSINLNKEEKNINIKEDKKEDDKKIISKKKVEESKNEIKLENENKIEENKEEFKNEIKSESDKNDNKDKADKADIDVRDLIDEQNFVEGYWEINKKTEKIKEKYLNEFNLLKGLKDKNINDKVAITILIIYYIKKEHSELLNELFMIIEKAKNYIKKNASDSYENILKEIGI